MIAVAGFVFIFIHWTVNVFRDSMRRVVKKIKNPQDSVQVHDDKLQPAFL
jgi:hypothetical protein